MQLHYMFQCVNILYMFIHVHIQCICKLLAAATCDTSAMLSIFGPAGATHTVNTAGSVYMMYT